MGEVFEMRAVLLGSSAFFSAGSVSFSRGSKGFQDSSKGIVALAGSGLRSLFRAPSM